jgi:predicted dehydrogenase
MYTFQSRRKFIFSSSILLGGGMISHPLSGLGNPKNQIGRIGIIGLDTSHSVAFTKALNGASENTGGFKIVAAYPNGSADIESSVKRIPGYTEEVKKYGVEIVGSVGALLSKVDFVCLETNDGRPHLQQALEVFKAGKPIFIDKPVAGSISDTIAIY